MSKNITANAATTMNFEDYMFLTLAEEDCEAYEYIRLYETDWAFAKYSMYLAGRNEKVMTFHKFVEKLGEGSEDKAAYLWWHKSEYCQKRYDAYLASFFD